MKKFFLALAFIALAAGCKSQVPPSNHTVLLTWTAPATGCSVSTPCAYVLSRATVTGTTCPATTGTAYTPLNQSAPVSALTYTDSTASGLSVCYIAQTVQGSAVSFPSNTAFIVVPANPLAPALGSPTTSFNDVPVLQSYPEILMSIASPGNLKARR